MTDDNFKLNQQEKYIFLNCLAFVLNLRQKVCTLSESSKKHYLEAHMKELDIPFEELKNIKCTKKPQAIIKELKSITSPKVRRYILRDMILLAIADHELSDEEITTIYEIGAGSGIKEEKVSEFFLWAARGVEWEIDGLRLLEEDS